MAAIRKPIFFWNAFHNPNVVPCPRQFDAIIFTPLWEPEKDDKKLKKRGYKVGWLDPLCPTLFATKIPNF